MAEHIDGGTKAPRVMLRQGSSKIVVSEAYPTQLYDLESDPGETLNLAVEPGHQELLTSLLEKVHAAWDLAQLRRDVVQSQRVRQLVNRALQKGSQRPWEHYPNPIREHTRFVRAGERFPDVERRSYLPYGD